MDFFEHLKKLNIENWPHGLLNESISTVNIQLARDEVEALIEQYYIFEDEPRGNMDKDTVKNVLDGLSQKITGAINNFPSGAFIKMGSRSPKDSFLAFKNKLKFTSGDQALFSILESERTTDDLFLFYKNCYIPCINVREYVKIPEWSEFRAFIKNKKLVGLSQYDYLDGKTYPEILQNANTIKWAVEKKVERIKDMLPLPDVICDFFVNIKSCGSENLVEVKLIEMNIFSAWTDPCLFDWNRDDFSEFEFRYIKRGV